MTLSPLPTFRKWLESTLAREIDDEKWPLLDTKDYARLIESDLIQSTEEDKERDDSSTTTNRRRNKALQLLLVRLDREYNRQHLQQPQDSNDGVPPRVKKSLLWHKYWDILEPIFSKLVARYIVLESKTTITTVDGTSHMGRPLDGVARFHLGNGAQFFRINVAANLNDDENHSNNDWSENGNEGDETSRSRDSIHLAWKQSFGIMVNYRYNLAQLAENQQHYQQEGDKGDSKSGLSHGRIPVSRHIAPWIPTHLSPTAIWVQE